MKAKNYFSNEKEFYIKGVIATGLVVLVCFIFYLTNREYEQRTHDHYYQINEINKIINLEEKTYISVLKLVYKQNHQKDFKEKIITKIDKLLVKYNDVIKNLKQNSPSHLTDNVNQLLGVRKILLDDHLSRFIISFDEYYYQSLLSLNNLTRDHQKITQNSGNRKLYVIFISMIIILLLIFLICFKKYKNEMYKDLKDKMDSSDKLNASNYETTHLINWSYDSKNNEFICSKNLHEIIQTSFLKKTSENPQEQDNIKKNFYEKKKLVKSIIKAIQQKEIFKRIVKIRTYDNKIKLLKFVGHPVYSISDEMDGPDLMGSLKDITEKSKYMKKLSMAKKNAEQALRIKDIFLKNIGHEIRTPLNAIIGLSDFLLEDGNLNFKQKQYIQTIQNSGSILAQTVTDILDLSVIETKKIDVSKNDIDLEKLISVCVNIFRPKINYSKIDFNVDVKCDIKNKLVSDDLRIQQIFINLLSNAIKFTTKGKIVLTVSKNDENKETEHFIFSVVDTGIGIPEDKQKYIFRKFYQIDSSLTKKYEGLGIGLALTQRMVHLLHGTISLESSTGEGTIFHVELPLKKSSVSLKDFKNLSSISNLTFAVVDDQDDNFAIIEQYLKPFSGKIDRIQNIDSAYKIIEVSVNSSHPYSAVIINFHPHKVEFLDFFDALEKNIGLIEKLQIFLYSPIHLEIKEKLKKIVHIIPRPSLKRDILRTLDQSFAVLEKVEEKQVKKKVSTEDMENILIVDDSVSNQDLLALFLKKSPHYLEMASNGKEAVEKCEKKFYRIILMDIQMPIMNGIDAMKNIRKLYSEKNYSNYYILAVTAFTFETEKADLLKEGFDEHMAKPVKKSLLIERVKHYVALKRNKKE